MATRLISPVTISEADPYVVYAEAIKNARYHIEVIDGVPREKLTPRRLHGIVQRRILELLAELYPADFILPSLDVLIGGTNFVVPDVVAFAEDAEFRYDMLASPALLAVEIMSPGQTFSDMLNKCERLHAAGTEYCWVIWPKKRRVWTYRPEDLAEEREVLRAPLPDGQEWRVRLEDLFRNLPDLP